MTSVIEGVETGITGQNHSAVLLSRRIAVALGLAGIAAVHILDLPGKFAETPYLGYVYLLLIVASFVIMERLITGGSRLDFAAAAALAAAVLIGFTINRTVGMPGAMDDIGNWFEPLGLLSLVIEAFVVWQAISAVVQLSAAPRSIQ
ncbi:hypothetical protein [Cryobacterium psychrophilum]|uniref:Uncharacterized protein n=1 Tax=Cryobacterium psychrophilum TaxID=41988 RepID=A0A4Y8KQ51_9MICO|nr:hypothetical protein [Cryobacterium psychrophilum]TDW29805.1 hypothetical protein EDD25_1518 [Cryobacterium psychrophilum]TFD80180.1 hypothetical protein E3T53_05875 [Cryobacterium psychrophilum]